MNFKLYFQNLSFIQKIELYSIPILLIFFIYFNIQKPQNTTNNIINNNIKLYQIKIKKLQNSHKIDQMTILKDIEDLSSKINIEIVNIEFKNKILLLEFQGDFLIY